GDDNVHSSVVAPSPHGLLTVFFARMNETAMPKKNTNNPWGEGATTLEWTLSSPPPFHSFDKLPRFEGKTASH
ncbi:MAG: hypothetical protein AAFQ11_03540, partial [Pseudomonadota bacterium]